MAACVLSLVSPTVGLAQDPPTTPGVVAPATGVRPASLLLEAPIDRAAYRLGPGDVLDVAILGDLTQSFSLTVGPEGTILVPGIGIASVVGSSLDQAEARIRDLVFRLFRSVSVKVTLARLRSFAIYVTGDVASPGIRAATAATRVSELLPPATGGVRRRGAVLRRAGGDTVSIDLTRFVQTGDLTANPALREGDALLVPPLDRTVEIFGRFYFPGAYEYKRGESLAELVYIANGGNGFPTNSADTLRLSRFTGRDTRTVSKFSLQQATGEEGLRFILQPSDAIFLSTIADFREQKVAEISGRVLRPGLYPIQPDTTTVRDLVALAGGFAPDASLVDATLRRRIPPPPTAQDERRLTGAVLPELMSDEDRRILRARQQGDPSAVVLDFERLFLKGDDVFNQTLKSGDVLNVPERRTGVTVLGAVARPGIVQYLPGRGVEGYVELAGGYSRRAAQDEVVILKSRSGNRTDARDPQPLDAGDQIIVPFRDRRSFFGDLQTAQAIIGTISGVLITILSIRTLF